MRTTHFQYTPFYCEENIWQLAQEHCFRGQQTMVVMVSGKGSHRRLWLQNQSRNPQTPVLWDYHVILLSFDDGWWVWDLDTVLGLPVHAATYFPATFLPPGVDAKNCDVILRLIKAEDYVRDFSSDRSHMKKPNGQWQAPPPEWPTIVNGGRSNLLDWLDIERDSPGQVLTLVDFIDNFVSGARED